MGWYRYRTFRVVEGESIPGVFLPAILHNFGHHLTLLAVYQDSMIDCWGLCTLDEFLEKIDTGWVVNTVPPGETVHMHHFASFKVIETHPHGSIHDLVKEVRSAIDELNDRPTAQERFIHAAMRYSEDRSEENLEALRTAHEELPSFYYPYIFGSRLERHKEIQQLLGIHHYPAVENV